MWLGHYRRNPHQHSEDRQHRRLQRGRETREYSEQDGECGSEVRSTREIRPVGVIRKPRGNEWRGEIHVDEVRESERDQRQTKDELRGAN